MLNIMPYKVRGSLESPCSYVWIVRVLFLLFCSVITVQGGEIQFSAGYQEYNQRLGIVILKEDASIVGTDFDIQGDNLQYDLNTGEIFARGNVELLKDSDLVRAQEIVYNVRTRSGRLEKFDSILQNAFVKGQSAVLIPQSMTLRDGCVTTCDHAHHHYKITARKMVLVPGRALYLKRASFFVGNRKILTVPAYKFSLDKDKNSQPFFIVPGYDLSRGLHAKINLDWYSHESLYGNLSLTPSARQGTEWSSDLHYGHSKKALSKLKMSEHLDKFRGARTLRGTLEQEWTHSFSKASTRVNYVAESFRSSETNQELNLGINFQTQVGNGFRAGIAYEAREDPDKDRYLLDNGIQSVDRLPEISLNSPTVALGSLPLRIRYGGRFTRFRERTIQGNVSRDVLEGTLGLFSERFKWGKTGLQFQSQARFSDYSAGESREYLSLNARLNQELFHGWALETFYNLHEVKGLSPFRSFDFILPREGMTHRLNYRGANLAGTLFQATYDIEKRTYSALSSYLNYRFSVEDTPTTLSLRTIYDPGANPSSLSALKLDRVFAGLRFDHGDSWDLNLQAQYSKKFARWESFTQTAHFLVGRRSRFQIQNHFNALQDEWTRLSLGWIQDFHCLEGSVDWDFKQKELAFQFYLKQGRGNGFGFQADYKEGLRVSPDLPDIVEP